MTITEEKLKEAADVFADFQNKREYVRSQKQEIINKIIPLEIQQQLNDLEEEFAGKEESIDLEEKTARRVLDMMIDQFVQSQQLTEKPLKIKSKFATISLAKGDVVWDAAALDGFAIAGHPEILSFRTEEKPKVRVTRTKL